MESLKVITSNYLINVCFVAWVSAQVLKMLLVLIVRRKLVLERLFGAGGMPSAHSALVCSLTVAIARQEGFASPLFALSLAFASIVMYDAMGVRRAAGEQAKVINQMVSGIFQKKSIFGEFPKLDEYFRRMKKKKPLKEEPSCEKQPESREESGEEPDVGMLNEYLGHTPMEVLGGALLGILVAMLMTAE